MYARFGYGIVLVYSSIDGKKINTRLVIRLQDI